MTVQRFRFGQGLRKPNIGDKDYNAFELSCAYSEVQYNRVINEAECIPDIDKIVIKDLIGKGFD